jgi:hypothetical protein
MRKGFVLGLFAVLLSSQVVFAVGISHDNFRGNDTREEYRINLRDFLVEIEANENRSFDFGNFFNQRSDNNRRVGFGIANGAPYVGGVRNGHYRGVDDSQTPAPVPEPSTMILLTTGLAALAALEFKYRRR